MCSVDFHTIHGQNNTRKCDTEDFVPVTILNCVVGFPSLSIRSLIGRTSEIWSFVYIYKNLMYTSKTVACTIRECAIVLNVIHVILNFLFISGCSGAANVKWTSWVWHLSLKSIEVNCFPASAKIISKSYHPNLSIFPNMDWNISSLSIPSSVLISFIP